MCTANPNMKTNSSNALAQIHTLFFDLDNKLLDFLSDERAALKKTFCAAGLTYSDAIHAQYRRISEDLWAAHEREEISLDALLAGRFSQLFASLDILGIDGTVFNAQYQTYLASEHHLMPGALKTVQTLHTRYALYAASNGIAQTQRKRLQMAGLLPYFTAIFVSQEAQAQKPSAAFFDYCFSRIPGFAPQNGMIIGDSLTSDIAGGKTVGLTTCYLAPANTLENPLADYTIHSLAALNCLLL